MPTTYGLKQGIGGLASFGSYSFSQNVTPYFNPDTGQLSYSGGLYTATPFRFDTGEDYGPVIAGQVSVDKDNGTGPFNSDSMTMELRTNRLKDFGEFGLLNYPDELLAMGTFPLNSVGLAISGNTIAPAQVEDSPNHRMLAFFPQPLLLEMDTIYWTVMYPTNEVLLSNPSLSGGLVHISDVPGFAGPNLDDMRGFGTQHPYAAFGVLFIVGSSSRGRSTAQIIG